MSERLREDLSILGDKKAVNKGLKKSGFYSDGSILENRRLLESAQDYIEDEDKVRFSVVGFDQQAMVVLESRVVIMKSEAGHFAKKGSLSSFGDSGGTKISEFNFNNITGFQFSTEESGRNMIIFRVPGISDQERVTTTSVLNFTSGTEVLTRPNVFPLDDHSTEAIKPYISELRELVNESGEKESQGIGEQLEKLSKLKEKGDLSEEEFEKAKEELLNS